MESLQFTKMNGAGNDFILIDNKMNHNVKLSAKLIEKMCDRRKGIGADGVLYILGNNDYDFELKYYNSNGSIGSLCGNGARCSIKYVLENYELSRSNTVFLCNGEKYFGCVENENIKFHLNEPSKQKLNIKIELDENEMICHFIDTGSPHVVFFWDNIKQFTNQPFNDFDIMNFGSKVRYHDIFSPYGTNVNIVHFDKEKTFIRTFERGVENETLACGTGTVAAAILSYRKNRVSLPTEFTTVGNDLLSVNFHENKGIINKITLTGPAKINYIGTYNF